ncbi:MAG: VCBS repeat-containing protein [Rubrivivax sp.]
MKRRGWLLLCYFALLLPTPFTLAEASVLSKGWTLGPGGSIAIAPSEVITGRASIKGSSAQPNTFVPFLYADPTIIRFAPSQTYTVTLQYRILKAASGTFSLDFNSPTAIAGGVFGPGTAINGPDGATGTATLSATLQAYGDYRLSFGVFGTGSIVIDDIQIADAGGRLVAAENAEGPSFAPSPLTWQVTDAMSILTPSNSTVISAARGDLDGDGYPEVVLALTAPRPSTTPIEPLILQASGRLRIANGEFFPAGMLTVKNSPMILFADINGDGLIDLLISDAGSDDPPFPGSKIGVGLNLGGGKFRDVSARIPLDLQATRSYAIAAGDIDGDGRVEIILPDQSRGGNTAALRWNGSGFEAQRDWIPQSIWMFPNNLFFQTWMAIADFDKDGKQDLLVTGDPGSPTMRIVFGGSAGVSNGTLLQLPAGPWGWVAPSQTRPPIEQGAEVGPVVVADFDNDGLPDIFAIERQIIYFQPGAITDTNIPGYASIHANGGYFPSTASLQVLMNRGARQFVDVSQRSSIQALQRAQYNGLIPIDLNNDGFVDLVGLYISEPYGDSRALTWGTTFFLNDGTGAFQVIDGSQLMGVTTTPSNGQQWGLGAFVPTRVTRERTEGVVFEGVGGCGANLCEAVGLKLYRVVADGAMGTGPNSRTQARLARPASTSSTTCVATPTAVAGKGSMRVARITSRSARPGATSLRPPSAWPTNLDGVERRLVGHPGTGRLR